MILDCTKSKEYDWVNDHTCSCPRRTGAMKGCRPSGKQCASSWKSVFAMSKPESLKSTCSQPHPSVLEVEEDHLPAFTPPPLTSCPWKKTCLSEQSSRWLLRHLPRQVWTLPRLNYFVDYTYTYSHVLFFLCVFRAFWAVELSLIALSLATETLIWHSGPLFFGSPYGFSTPCAPLSVISILGHLKKNIW